MKTKIVVAIIALLGVLKLQAQQEDTLEKRFLLNFVIPDMPAYKSLGIEKSDLLRPSDVKEFALMLSPFYNNGKASIPKNFGLEFSPWKMASRKWTLKDYNDKAGKRLLYNSSFSIAAANDSTKYSSKISLGYRVAILSDKADIIRIAYSKSSDFSQKADDARTLKSHLEIYWVTKFVNPSPNAVDRPTYIDSHQDEFYKWLASINTKDKTMDDLLKTYVYEARRIFGDDFIFEDFKTMKFDQIERKLLNKLILEYKTKNWNAPRADLAIAFVAESKDSLFTNTRFSSFNIWATGALKVGKRGQWLIGGNLKIPNSNIDSVQTSPLNFTLGSRLLIGNSNFRFFGEAQWKKINYGEIQSSILLNIGAELRISDKFWVVASSGIDNLKNKEKDKWFNQLVANIDLRYGFNF